MLKTIVASVALIALALALPASAKTYKDTLPVPCGEVWTAVKDVLGDAEHYNVKETDDAKMHAVYQPKHTVHVTVTETLLQRMNKVTLIPKGAACEMQVVSNYSGVEHNDREDFKKRVDESLAKQKSAPPAK